MPGEAGNVLARYQEQRSLNICQPPAMSAANWWGCCKNKEFDGSDPTCELSAITCGNLAREWTSCRRAARQAPRTASWACCGPNGSTLCLRTPHISFGRPSPLLK